VCNRIATNTHKHTKQIHLKKMPA